MPNEYTSKKRTKSSTKNMEKLIIESLLTKYTNENNESQSKKDDQQMVGYYTTSVTENSRLVVCSPDLPITVSKLHLPQVSSSTSNFPQVTSSEVPRSPEMTATIAPPGPPGGAVKGKNSVTTTSTGEDPYQCNICSKTFAVPARLTRHYRTHTGEKPFQCEYCAKSFSVKENLSVHRRIHTKERPYKCEVCARAFEHSGKLHRHMRIHTGERPHKCTVCSKTFIQSGQLVIHMRTHTGEKPYVCGVCTKGFTCSKQLKVHSRTHTGEKPYACDICGKCFGYNHVLKLHQVAHYGEKVYKCTICNDTFNSKKDMETHIKSHSDNASSSPSTSDKENTDSSSTPPSVAHYEDRYLEYLQPSNVHSTQSLQLQSGVELLAAAAAVQGINDNLPSLASREDVINLITTHNSRRLGITTTNNSVNPTLMRHPAYFSVGQVYEGNFSDIRRRVEEVLEVASAEEDPLLITPPSSNPVSPAPNSSPELSSSPDPVEARLQISLPPRKRSKMILKSMESEYDAPVVRYNSVIQYAKAL